MRAKEHEVVRFVLVNTHHVWSEWDLEVETAVMPKPPLIHGIYVFLCLPAAYY